MGKGMEFNLLNEKFDFECLDNTWGCFFEVVLENVH